MLVNVMRGWTSPDSNRVWSWTSPLQRLPAIHMLGKWQLIVVNGEAYWIAPRANALHVSSISLSMPRLAKRLDGHVLRVFDSNGITNRC